MQIVLVKKSIDISASRSKVWQVLIDDACTRKWYKPFAEGCYADTDWKTGSKVVVTDGKGGGMIGHVLINRPMDVLAVEYTGQLLDGKEDYDSEFAKGIQGMKETYRLSDKEGFTHLSVDCDMASSYSEKMSASWDEALNIIRQLAEED